MSEPLELDEIENGLWAYAEIRLEDPTPSDAAALAMIWACKCRFVMHASMSLGVLSSSCTYDDIAGLAKLPLMDLCVVPPLSLASRDTGWGEGVVDTANHAWDRHQPSSVRRGTCCGQVPAIARAIQNTVRSTHPA